jgi:hypothetical protein
MAGGGRAPVAVQQPERQWRALLEALERARSDPLSWTGLGFIERIGTNPPARESWEEKCNNTLCGTKFIAATSKKEDGTLEAPTISVGRDASRHPCEVYLISGSQDARAPPV